MDNTIPSVPPPEAPSVLPPVTAVPSQPVDSPIAATIGAPTVQQVSGGGGSSKMKWLLIGVGLIGLLGIIGGSYLYLSNQPVKQAQQAVQVDTSELDNFNSEVSQIDLGDVQSDFVEVDQDLQTL